MIDIDAARERAAESAAGDRNVTTREARRLAAERRRETPRAVRDRERGPDDTWRDKAACRGKDTAAFFPGPENGRVRLTEVRRACQLCEQCSVSAECLSYALGIQDLHGIWAGTTPGQRDAIRRGEPPRRITPPKRRRVRTRRRSR